MSRSRGRRPVRTGCGGQAVAEYAAVVAVVVALVLALTVLGSRRAARVPIDPVRSVGALVAPAPVVRAPRVAPVRRAAPRVRTAPRRARRVVRRPVVTGPRWAVGR